MLPRKAALIAVGILLASAGTAGRFYDPLNSKVNPSTLSDILDPEAKAMQISGVNVKVAAGGKDSCDADVSVYHSTPFINFGGAFNDTVTITVPMQGPGCSEEGGKALYSPLDGRIGLSAVSNGICDKVRDASCGNPSTPIKLYESLLGIGRGIGALAAAGYDRIHSLLTTPKTNP